MYSGSIFFEPVEFCCTIYCYGNNAAMATEKYLCDCATKICFKSFVTYIIKLHNFFNICSRGISQSVVEMF